MFYLVIQGHLSIKEGLNGVPLKSVDSKMLAKNKQAKIGYQSNFTSLKSLIGKLSLDYSLIVKILDHYSLISKPH